MERNQPLELSEEEKKELSIRLLREWWIGSTNALVETVGSESALQHLKPHFMNAGRAGQSGYLQLVGLPPDDVLAAFSGMAEPLAAMLDADGDRIWIGGDGSLMWELLGCRIKGTCKEACLAFCDYCLSEAHPPLEGHLLESRVSGDASCVWIWHPEGRPPRVERTERFLMVEEDRERYRPDKALQEYLGLAWMGEFWVITTRAFVECVGSEQATDQLISLMGRSGRSLGISLTRLMFSTESDVDRMARIIELIQSLHHIKCRLVQNNKTEDGYVDECPFSGSPSEICLQYEAFFNGICEAIDPTYEFAYDKMMTKGDKTCHWVIKKKGTGEKELTDEKATSDDPFKRLTNKFIDGQITVEEFENKLEILRKHKIVK